MQFPSRGRGQASHVVLSLRSILLFYTYILGCRPATSLWADGWKLSLLYGRTAMCRCTVPTALWAPLLFRLSEISLCWQWNLLSHLQVTDMLHTHLCDFFMGVVIAVDNDISFSATFKLVIKSRWHQSNIGNPTHGRTTLIYDMMGIISIA